MCNSVREFLILRIIGEANPVSVIEEMLIIRSPPEEIK